MARVSTYLNFARETEAAFTFYQSVFGGEFEGGGMMRMKDVPPYVGQPELTDEDKELIMHVGLPLLGGHMLYGTDSSESMGFTMNYGNNIHINLEPDTREEADRLFRELSVGGTVEMELQDMFWGDYFGSLRDRFKVQWMINCSEKKAQLHLKDKDE